MIFTFMPYIIEALPRTQSMSARKVNEASLALWPLVARRWFKVYRLGLSGRGTGQ